MIGIDIIRKKRKTGGTVGGSVDSGISTASGGDALNALHADEADHANRADEATHSASAKELDGTSSVWNTIRTWISGATDAMKNVFLRKDQDDSTPHKLTMGEAEVTGYATVGGDAAVKGDLKIGKDGTYSISKDGIATLAGVVAEKLRSFDFRSGYFDGSGFGLYTDENGRSVAEVDRLYIRMKAVFAELEIRKLSYVGGDQVHSFAGSKIELVKRIGTDGNIVSDADTGSAITAYKCYYSDDDGTTRTQNWWRVGDQARCQTFNIENKTTKKAENRYYWRLVTATGSEEVSIANGEKRHMGYVVLSNQSEPFTLPDPNDETKNIQYNGADIGFLGYDTSVANDAPAADDSIVQLGSQCDAERAYAYVIYVTEQKRVDYAGINDYRLAEHAVAQYSPQGSFVYSKWFQMRAGTPDEWHPMTNYRGEWQADAEYDWYDTVTHGGLLWTQADKGHVSKNEEPSKDSKIWKIMVSGVTGPKGDKGDDGESAIDIQITTDKGVTLRPGLEDTTMTAHVYLGGDDVTSALTVSDFSWTRTTSNEESDKAWNDAHSGIGNVITVTKAEVFRRALFECEVDKKKVYSLK